MDRNGENVDKTRGAEQRSRRNEHSNQSSRGRGKRSLFARLYSPGWIALGVVAGLVLSLFTGIVIVYNDMMSGVTFSDETFNEPVLAKDLTDEEWLGGLADNEKQQLEDDFGDLQDLLDGGDPDESSGDAPSTSPSFTKGDKPKKDTPKKDNPKQDASKPVATEAPPKLVSMKGIDNIVLFGVDSRANNFRGRADVTMILSLNHNTKTLNIVSLMRAMYVKIGTAKHPWGMLNASYSYGGPNLAVRTIERNYGIPIKGYVAINFGSFTRIIDAVGGVRISLTAAEARHLGLEPGSQVLNGANALRYARIRKIDSDFQRNRRQRNVVNSVLSSMGSGGVDIYNVINVALANTRTNLNLRDYMKPSYLSYSRRQLQLPAFSDTRRTYVKGMEVWPFNMAKTHKKLVNFLTGN